MNTIQQLDNLYKHPVLLFYWYHFKRGHKTLKEWRRELDQYKYAEPNHPLRKFVEMVDKYAI